MTSISLTSGEILDIISALHYKVKDAEIFDEPHLAAYYVNIIQQFEGVYDKVQDFVPENKVANLILACN